MIKRKVTLVLGAGASHPYGFPLGGKLKTMIIDQLIHSTKSIYERNTLGSYLEQFGFSETDNRDFAIQLQDSMQPSVDAFLFDRPEFMDIGKLAIAANLILCEDLGTLMYQTTEGGLNKWYDYLLNLMGTRDEFKSNNLSIITFNYDRSLEYFIYTALKARFKLSEQEIVEFIESIPIVHIYGQLGKPLFMDSNGRDYSKVLNYDNLKKSIDNISLIYEEQNEELNSDNYNKAYNIITESDLLVFIGFGYHEENLKRLKLEKYYKTLELVGTFYGMQKGEIERAKGVILRHSVIPGDNVIRDFKMDAFGFLRETNYLQ